MTVTKQNDDIVSFLKQKDYVMVNKELGRGSFGRTVLLKDPFIDELFVAKKYEPDSVEDKAAFYKNFLDEIKIMYKLNHRNIVRIYNYYAYEKIYSGYILMEYIEGKDIAAFIRDYIPWDDVSLNDIFAQLIDAFCYMEEHNIVHRDIREGNILIDKTGTVKVIDFGIGKIFSKPDEKTDSLAWEINRAASDTLPQEYYEGVYTSLTDMFYLAELIQRLIKNADNCDESDFSYWKILQKMMEKKPEKRYQSFSDVRDAIGKHDFLNMDITEEDKNIYREFTDNVRWVISAYMEKPRFVTDPATFVTKLSNALEINLFETIVQNNSDIISSIVSCRYRYDNRNIPVKIVKDFFDWFLAFTPQSQTLILKNFISKISNITVEEPEPELPF